MKTRSPDPIGGAQVAVIFGSGLSQVPQGVRLIQELDYRQLPGFPRPRVKGHPGRFLSVEMNGKTLFLFLGRAHFYEGHDFEALSAPFRTLARWGVRRIISTFACGSLVPAIRPGDIVCVRDQINLMGVDLLRGRHTSGLFLNPGRLYDKEFNARVRTVAQRFRIRLREGIYAGVSGPTFETPVEAVMMRRLGAHVVGMSLVPEALAAKQAGMTFAALGYVSNRAGSSGEEFGHADVLEMGKKASPKLWQIICGVL